MMSAIRLAPCGPEALYRLRNAPPVSCSWMAMVNRGDEAEHQFGAKPMNVILLPAS